MMGPPNGTAAGERQPLVGGGQQEHQQQGRRRGVRRRRGDGRLGIKADGLLDEPLPESVVWAYSAGHVLNDASAACWFSYLLIYCGYI
jgi:hypothetical protein